MFAYDGMTRHQMLYGGTDESRHSTVTNSSEAAPLTSEDLLTQQGAAPTKKTSQTNQLDLNEQTQELYLTTDGGSAWSFVPLNQNGCVQEAIC